MMVFSERAA
jgi:hypothetical protein